MIASLPKHQYIRVDSAFTHKNPVGFVPTVWFGISSFHGRVWGCHVLLESGAVYRNLPPHAIAFSDNPAEKCSVEECQLWDCYGRDFDVVEYTYLAGLDVQAKVGGRELAGKYLFTVC